MFLIYYLIVLYSIVQADDSNHTKYIDSLPDKDKSIVLDKVARRILEDVNTKDERDKYKGEITDEQLQKHDDFVKKILKEESENLRRDSKKAKETKKHGKHLDLTLRSVNDGENDKLSKVPVVVKYSNDSKAITNTENRKKDSSVEDIQIKKFRRNAEETSNTETVVTTESATHLHEMQGTQINNFEPEVKGHGSEESSDTVDNTTGNNSHKEGTTTDTYSEVTTTDVAINKSISGLNGTTVDADYNTEDINYVTKIVSWSGERNDSCSDEDSAEKLNKSRKFSDISSDNLHNNGTGQINTPTKINASEVIDNAITVDIRLATVSRNIPVSHTINAADDLRENILSSNVESFTETNKNNDPTKYPSRMPENLNDEDKMILNCTSAASKYEKGSMVLEKLEREQNKHFKTINTGNLRTENSDKQEYRVFEVDADKPFIQSEKTVDQGQPYFVPVYNYAPNNAYFNAYNRMGLNDEAEQPNIETEKGLRNNHFEDEYYFDKGDSKTARVSGIKQNPKIQYVKRYETNVPAIIGNPSHSVNNYGANDYHNLDVEQYARVRKEIPSSSEPEHPFNSMGMGLLKSHLSAVRQMLFSKSFFGSISTVPKPMHGGKRSNIGKDNTNDDSGGDKGIPVDYYLGRNRKESDGDQLKKVGYIRQNNITRNVFLKDIPKEGVKRIHFNNQNFVKSDYQVTPHTEFSNVRENDTLKPMKRFFWFFKKKAPSRPVTTTTEFVTEDGELDSISNISDESDLFVNLEALQGMNVPLRTRQEEDVAAYITVLKDMVHLDNDGLKQYDWLGTTVDIQAALNKLANLTEFVTHDSIHPLDLELLKYMIFLHKASRPVLRSEVEVNGTIPQHSTRKRKEEYVGKDTEALNDLDDFQDFIYDLLYHLYDFHSAIKKIAAVTKYRHQKWYKNLKDIYFKNDHEVLSVILHLATSRLFGLVEDSSKQGLENDYIGFVLKHEKEAVTTVREFKFVLKLLIEIKELPI